MQRVEQESSISSQKQYIVSEVIAKVERMGGRFLEPVAECTDRTQKDYMYRFAPKDQVHRKARQALRDKYNYRFGLNLPFSKAVRKSSINRSSESLVDSDQGKQFSLSPQPQETHVAPRTPKAVSPMAVSTIPSLLLSSIETRQTPVASSSAATVTASTALVSYQDRLHCIKKEGTSGIRRLLLQEGSSLGTENHAPSEGDEQQDKDHQTAAVQDQDKSNHTRQQALDINGGTHIEENDMIEWCEPGDWDLAFEWE